MFCIVVCCFFFSFPKQSAMCYSVTEHKMGQSQQVVQGTGLMHYGASGLTHCSSTPVAKYLNYMYVSVQNNLKETCSFLLIVRL